jgi:hypothetical protein
MRDCALTRRCGVTGDARSATRWLHRTTPSRVIESEQGGGAIDMKLFTAVGIVAALNLSMLGSVNGLAFPGPQARPMAVANDVQLFAGRWTAMHDGIRIAELALRVEKGRLAGAIRICTFTINTESTGKIGQVTNDKLSADLPLRNLIVSGKSVAFDWKDPDGDENHWKLELTGTDAGQLIWVGLPNGLKAEPIPVSRSAN